MKYVPEDRPIVVTGAVYNLTKTNNLMADLRVPSSRLKVARSAHGVEIEAKAALSASV